MPDYMYLLESRLSPEQRAALERVQELSVSQEINVYLTGGAIRDLISGQPIRDLDFTVEGNPVRMVRELEKGGARVVWENEKLRHYEMIFAGDADGSISAARDDVYDKPGAKPEYRFGGIMEDLRRRDFSFNAIAISLNAQSRGLLLDPTNGLADLERQEVRALSIHAFTNQPVRLMRILRYCARMGSKMESRTQEWFELAMERHLYENIEGAEAGHEVRALAREDNPTATLKQWESRGLLASIHPRLQKRKPDYDSLNKLARIRSNFLDAGIRPRPQVAITGYVIGRLKSREAAAALRNMEFRSAEVDAIAHLIPEAQKVVKILKSRKTNSARDAYFYIASVPPEMLVFIEVELPNPRAVSKIRNYVQKWRPMRLALPFGELDALGVARGPKFDKIIEQLFEMQLRGKARSPEDRTKALRNLAGIKEEPKKKEEKPKKKSKETEAAPAAKAPDAKSAKHGDKHPQQAAPEAPRAPAKAAPSSAKPVQSAAAAIGARAQAKHDDAAKAHHAAHKHAPAPRSKPKARAAKKARGR
jgi:tRNA nucleotidyltransferase (CCA-adding enzyme)